MSADGLAIARIQEELSKSAKGGSLSISSLSIKVKWGQGKLTNLGTCRAFLQRHPEVFTIDGSSVSLAAKEGSVENQKDDGSARKAKRRRFDDEEPAVATPVATPPSQPPPSPPTNGFPSAERASPDTVPQGVTSAAALTSPPSWSPVAAAPAAAAPAVAPAPTAIPAAAPAAPAPAAPPDSTQAQNHALAPSEPAPPPPPPPKLGGGLEVGQSPAMSSRAGLAGGSSPSPEVPRTTSEPPKGFSSALAPKSLASQNLKTFGSWPDDTLNNDALAEKIAESKLRGIELELELLLERAGLMSLCDQNQDGGEGKDSQESSRIIDSIKSEAEEPGKGLEVEVQTVGAHLQGTPVKDTDFDMLVTIKDGTKLSEQLTFARKLREGLESLPGLKVGPARHRCPGLGTAKFSLEFVWREPTTSVHVFVATKSEAQLSQRLDECIKKLCDSWPRSRAFAGLVKLWAGSHNLVFDSDLNGTAWTIIALYYLQKEGYLAALSLDSDQKEAHKPPDFPGWAKMFQGFVAFLADLPACSELSLSSASERVVTSGRAPILLEDPTPREKGNDAARKNLIPGLKKARWTQVIGEARQCSDRLDRKPLRWFHWIEVFDPEDQPVKRIGGLKEAVSQLGPIPYGQIPPEYYFPRPSFPPISSMPVPPPPPPGKGHGQGGYRPQKRPPIMGASQIYGNRG
mmetsp:Transcript_2850/g.6248  ORF Transcript_2850/g.6248 Transcript_2850/m.6248 type:complete len:685 (-) Transcript_2850:55-2109(-)